MDPIASTAALEADTAARGAARRLLRAAAAAMLLLAAGLAAAAHADERIRVDAASLELRGDADPGVFLNAQFEFELPQALADAVDRGVAVYFVADFELTRNRWYWFDENVANETLGWRLSYSPLTRQYRLARGGLAQPFDSIGAAVAAIRRVSGWKVLDAGVLQPGDHYHAQVRLRLDTSLLPKPFQVTALTNRDWSLASDWYPVAVGAELAAGR
jgi:hypothetical protein